MKAYMKVHNIAALAVVLTILMANPFNLLINQKSSISLTEIRAEVQTMQQLASLPGEIQTLKKNINSINEQIQENALTAEDFNDLKDQVQNGLKEVLIQEVIQEWMREKTALEAGKIYRNGDRNSNKVAITIDDGGNPERVRKALDYLKQTNTKATLFPIGQVVEANPGVWRRAVREGHELGNHTYSHRHMTSLTEKRILEEMTLWQKAVDNCLGYPFEAFFFRPPGMAGFTPNVNVAYYRQLVARQNMIVALWDIEVYYDLYSQGGLRRLGDDITPQRLANYVVSKARGGSIILLHFNHTDIEALPLIIHGLRRKGLEPVTLSELLLFP
jgi:peptidoglycan/xylan/chitin deacetylase (PgdA/CDA1 family)